MTAGALVAFEGIDGAGKTTQVARLAAALRAAGRSVVETREPTDGPYGRRIRAEARAGRRAPAAEELRWFLADRREHVDRVIAPALAAGQVVLTDRYTLSTVAYQGARGLDPVRLLRQAERSFPMPDLALLFWIDPVEGLRRVSSRAGAREEAFEQRGVLEAVARTFATLAPPYLARVDAAAAPEVVAERVLATIRERLPALAPPAFGDDEEA